MNCKINGCYGKSGILKATFILEDSLTLLERWTTLRQIPGILSGFGFDFNNSSFKCEIYVSTTYPKSSICENILKH